MTRKTFNEIFDIVLKTVVAFFLILFIFCVGGLYILGKLIELSLY